MTLIDTTRRNVLKLLGTGAAITAFGTGTAGAQPDGGPVFEIKSMVGNDLTGTDGAIRDIDAGGLPWVLDEAEVKLDSDGTLKVEVEGLVLADDPSVPEELRETNPVPEFRAILSCLAPDSDGHVIQNVRTDTFPATEEGDSEIEEMVDVPDLCLAPIVFVTSPGDAWFAVTGS